MRTEHGSAYYLILVITLFSFVTCDVSHVFQNHQSNVHPRQTQSSNFELTENNHGHNGNHDSSGSSTGWDIRLSVPGEPDKDYPTLSVIPKTSFNCVGKSAGYYSDTQTRCQVFRVCANTAPEGFFSFLCPNGTLFNQEVLVCDWWMNVKCMDAEKYSDINNPKNTDDGSQMLSEIKKMIMYPMSNPYPINFPPMNKVMQVYNPPSDMFSFLQGPVNQGDNNGFKLPGPFIGPITNTKDSAISGSDILNTNKFYNNHQYNNQGNRNEKSRNFFTADNFNGLNLHNTFDENTQAIKITKQQFTYPSQYDKEYTLRVPKLPLPHPFVVRLPINIPALDTVSNSINESNHTAENHSYKTESSTNQSLIGYEDSQITLNKLSKGLPFIVLFLQPPFETSGSNVKASYDSTKESSSQINHNVRDSKIYSSQYDSQTQYFPKTVTSANISYFSANIKSQNNQITNNQSSTESTLPMMALEADSENITDANLFNNKPARLTLYSNNASLNDNVSATKSTQVNVQHQTESSTETYQSAKIINEDVVNANSANNNGLVTLFSAHVIPSGDVNKQKVFKICIPKDILSYIVDLHNSTKRAIQSKFMNNKSILENISNTTIHIHSSQPLLKTIMENLMKNHSLNQQVPISTGEELYQRQKYINENIANFQAYNQNFESRFHNTNAKYSSDSVQGLTQKVERPVFAQIVQSPLPITKPYIGPSITDINTQQNGASKANYESQNISTKQSKVASNIADDSFKNASIQTTHFVATSQPLPNGFRTQKQFTTYNQEVYGNIQNLPAGQLNIAKNELQNTVQNNNYKQYKAYSDTTLENKANLYNQAQVRYSNNSTGVSFDNNNIKQINSAAVLKNESVQFVSQHTQTTGKHTQTAVKSSQQYTVQNNGISTDNRLGKVIYAEKQTNIRPTEESYQNGHLISVQQHFPSRIVAQPGRVTQTNTNVPQFTQSNQKESNSISTQSQYSGIQQKQNYVATQNTYQQNSQNIQAQYPQNMYIATGQLNNIKATNQPYNSQENQIRTLEGYRTTNQNQNQQYVMSNMQSPSIKQQSQYDALRYNQYNGYTNEQNINTQMQYNTNRMQLENQNRNEYYKNQNYVVQQPQDENVYTTVEVVPAIGYALNTQEEKDHYYASIRNGYSSPSIGAIVPIQTQTQTQTQNNRYSINSGVQRNENVVNAFQRFGNENRLVHGQVIMHTRAQNGGNNARQHSLPLEDLGYPRERPDVEFTF